jgi:ABC-type sugar transport system permease subunit
MGLASAMAWILFIIAAAVRNIALAIFRMREGKHDR